MLIFTPLVFDLVEEVEGKDWTLSNKIPSYFAVLYVANVAGALVISNPINIVVARISGRSLDSTNVTSAILGSRPWKEHE